jgi:RNA polymerase sigma factor (sigma-70 family)
LIDPSTLLEHSAFVRALARGLLCDESRLDDVVQQTWLAAIEKPPREARSLKTWLGSVALNFARKSRREESRRAAREERSARLESPIDPLDVLARESAIRAVVDAVFALREPYRTVVVLRFYDDLPPAEIAKRLGVPVETVRTRLKRAIARLRSDLDHSHDGDRSAWALALAPFAGLAATRANSAVLAGQAASRGGRRSSGAIAAAPVVLLIAGIALWSLWPRSDSVRDAAPAARVAPTPATEPSDAPLVAGAGASTERIARARVAAGTGALVAKLRFEDGGDPAAGVRARVVPLEEARSQPLPAGHRLDRVTGEDGSFRADGLAPGDYRLVFDRMEIEALVSVRSGGEATIDVQVPRGITLDGVVCDVAGHPLPRSQVLLFSPFPSDCGAVVGEAAADGTFRVRSISRSGWLAARAPGFALSALVALPPHTIRTQTIRLVASACGGAIAGIVTDDGGQPLAGACVIASGDPAGGANERAAGALTAEDGTFHLDGLAEGDATVVVTAPGFAPWISEQSVRERETPRVTARLARGARLAGSVREASGEPVSRARVDVRSAAFPRAPLVLSALTTAAGEFVVEHAPLGAIHASVDDDDSDDEAHRSFFARIGGGFSAADGSFRVGHVYEGSLVAPRTDRESLGEAAADFVCAEGEAIRWDATLDRGRELRGRLIDETGAPLASWTVVATPPGRGPADRTDRRSAVSDVAGRFAVPNCADVEYRIEIFEPDAFAFNPCWTVAGSRPGASDAVIRVPSSARASAWVRGRLVQADGSAAAGVAVSVRPKSAMLVVNRRPTDASGEYRIGPLPPGDYDVLARLPGIGETLRAGVALGVGETLDLGTIVLRPGGSLLASLRRDDGRPLGRPDIWIFDATRATYSRPSLDGDVVRVDSLPPGRWFFSVSPSVDSDVACAEFPFEIRSGAETALAIALCGDEPVVLRFVEPEGQEWASFVHAVLRSPAGDVVWEHSFGRFLDGDLRATVRLGRGRYALEAVTDDGAKASATISIPPDSGGRIEIPLRRAK